MNIDARKIVIPTVVASLVAFGVFNFFYTVVITPLAIPTPLAYCAPDDKPIKLIVHVDRMGDITAYQFWYEWPYDGYYTRPDWEPVIVYYKDGSIYAVATRAHYNWRVDFHPPIKDGRVVVTFAYLWHTPLLKSPPSDYVKVDLIPMQGQPPEAVDPFEIIGVPSPLSNALVSAITYALIAFATTFVATSYLVSKVF